MTRRVILPERPGPGLVTYRLELAGGGYVQAVMAAALARPAGPGDLVADPDGEVWRRLEDAARGRHGRHPAP